MRFALGAKCEPCGADAASTRGFSNDASAALPTPMLARLTNVRRLRCAENRSMADKRSTLTFAKRPRILLRERFTHLHAIERADIALRFHRERGGSSGGLAEGHRGGGDAA